AAPGGLSCRRRARPGRAAGRGDPRDGFPAPRGGAAVEDTAARRRHPARTRAAGRYGGQSRGDTPQASGRVSRALILDDEGGFVAPTAAEALVAAGCTVEIATTHTSVGALINPTQQPFVLRRLALAGVVQSPNLEWVSGAGAGVRLRHLYTEQVEIRTDADLVVGAGRRRGEASLRAALRAEAPGLPVTLAGDAVAPRTLLDAVAEGARAGATIEIDRPVPIPAPIGGQESDLVGA